MYMYRLPSSPYPPPVPGCGGPASVGTPKPGTWKPFVTLYIYIYICKHIYIYIYMCFGSMIAAFGWLQSLQTLHV